MTTVTETHDRNHPRRYKCPNFDVCGVSCSHDPEYMGWPITGLAFPRRACSPECVRALWYSRLAGI